MLFKTVFPTFPEVSLAPITAMDFGLKKNEISLSFLIDMNDLEGILFFY